MERSYILSHVLLLLFLTNGAISKKRVLIDVESDIPTGDGSWELDCVNGYGELSTDIDCGDFGGRIDIPAVDLNGERGFWTNCGYCEIKYHVQPGDVSIKARLYQSSLQTEISFDGVNWEFFQGEGWVVMEKELGNGDANVIALRFDHFSSDTFNLLEKIVINGDFDPTDPDPTTTTRSTSIGSTTASDCPTTTVEPPCNCCERCSKHEPEQEIHHHYHNYYHYRPTSVPDAK